MGDGEVRGGCGSGGIDGGEGSDTEAVIASGLTLGLLFGILLTQLPWGRWRLALSGGGEHRRVSFAGSSEPDEDVVPAVSGALGGVPDTPATMSADDEEDPGDHELT